MNIITEEPVIDRFQDGINTILYLNQQDFERFVNLISIKNGEKIQDRINFVYADDKCNNPEGILQIGLDEKNNRRYGNCNDTNILITDLLSKFDEYMKTLEVNSPEYIRCSQIIATRSKEALIDFLSNENPREHVIIDNLFEILSNNSLGNAFLNYEDNQEQFLVENKKVDLEEYLKTFGDIFKYFDESEDYFFGMQIFNNYCIPDSLKEIIKQNAIDIYKNYYEQYTRLLDKRYEFKVFDCSNEYAVDDCRIIRKNDEPNWEFSEGLRTAVLSDMPLDLSLEEQALFIYVKLCEVLEYDEEYSYRNEEISSQFSKDFSKEYLETIVPGSKITCYDFSRIFSKFVNELEGDIEAVVISQGTNGGHFLTGFYTDNVQVRLEAININLDGHTDPTNDLMKAKNGIKLRGIRAVHDKDEILNDSINKIYGLIYGKDALTIKGFVAELKAQPKVENVPDDLGLKLQSFIDVMKDRGIAGNEFVQTLEGMYKSKFFGTSIEKAYIGRRYEQDGEKHIQRMMLFRQRGDAEQDKQPLFLIDTSSLELTQPTEQQLIEKLNSGSILYESSKYKIKGIDREVTDDDTAK